MLNITNLIFQTIAFGGAGMSDFLRNLRSSQKKESPVTRRHSETPYYPPTDRRKVPDRRSAQSAGLEMLWSNLNDILPLLVDNTTQLSKYLEQHQQENALLIQAKIRQHNAISNFFDNMNRLFSEGSLPDHPPDKPHATTSYASGTHYTKDDILQIIQTMRKDGTTFAVIADYLKKKGIPTFSGRGEWHAQTIHRLCK